MSNFQVFKFSDRVPVKAWVNGVGEVEQAAIEQLKNIAGLPFIHSHVAAMPDVHLGKGSTVGSVFGTKGAIIPAAVGVDIGCGMMAQQTNLKASDLPENLKAIREAIENVVPVGKNHWHNVPALSKMTWLNMEAEFKEIIAKNPSIEKNSVPEQLGTLGGGNHFIEICLDENQNVWIMLHCGSRNIGNRIGTRFIEIAKEDMRRHFINLPDKDLSYLVEGTEHFVDYVKAVRWAQNFARSNRNIIMEHIFMRLNRDHEVLGIPPITPAGATAVNCHHNYVEIEHHYGENVYLTRKGAVRARVGDMGIIPGSMGAKSYIVRGKGNPEAFHSCSHGAGRRMSRGKAKEVFTLDDHIKATSGVECRKDQGVIDETPGAYKDIDAVMAAQSDLVEIVHTLKQVVCVKG